MLPLATGHRVVPWIGSFLVHAHRAIRLRAIRLLDKGDRPEALAHLAATLAAEDPAERAAALDQVLLLPFPAVKPLVLRFLGLDNDPALVAKAGRLFQINPDPEAPVHLAELLATSGPERRRQLSDILLWVLTALAAAGPGLFRILGRLARSLPRASATGSSPAHPRPDHRRRPARHRAQHEIPSPRRAGAAPSAYREPHPHPGRPHPRAFGQAAPRAGPGP